MTNAVFRQHRFQLGVGHFIPQRLAFHLVGVDIACIRNMADQIELRRAPGGFNHLIVARRFRRNVFPLLQVVQPLWINQLFEVRQLLQTLGLLQRVAQGGNVGVARFFQAFRHRVVIFAVAVEGNVSFFFQLVLLRPGDQLFIVHGGKPAGGEV